MSHSGNFEKGTSPVRECNMGLIPFPTYAEPFTLLTCTRSGCEAPVCRSSHNPHSLHLWRKHRQLPFFPEYPSLLKSIRSYHNERKAICRPFLYVPHIFLLHIPEYRRR